MERGRVKRMTGRTLCMSALIVAAVLAACSVASLVALSEKAEATSPGKNGRIAFDAYVSKRGSPSQIFTINPNGSGERQLTHSSSVINHSPSYSPDGRKLAFARGGNSDARGADIYLKKFKDGSVRRVTGGGHHHEFAPVFSPDGSRIAFLRQKFVNFDYIIGEEIATVRPDGTGLEVLTPPEVSPGSPDWSPDGRKLVFAISLNAGGRIQTVEADGTNRQTVFSPGPHFYPYGPVFSPDSKKIAFGNDHEGRHIADPWNIWTVGAHGKNPTCLTHPGAAGRLELRPDWGPRPTGQ